MYKLTAVKAICLRKEPVEYDAQLALFLQKCYIFLRSTISTIFRTVSMICFSYKKLKFQEQIAPLSVDM